MRVHANDLEAIYQSLGLVRDAPLDQGHGMLIAPFLAIAEAMEPSLIFSSEDDRLDWAKGVAEIKYALSRWTAGVRTILRSGRLVRMADIAKRSWRAPRAGHLRELPFIVDAEMRAIAERDLATLASARMQSETKTALVMAGCVIEAVLLDVIDRQPQEELKAAAQRVKDARQAKNPRVWGNFRPAEVEGWQLVHLVGVTGSDGLGVLSPRTEQKGEVIRDWRNFIHPRKEREETRNAPLRPSDAAAAEAFVEAVLDDVSTWSSRTGGGG